MNYSERPFESFDSMSCWREYLSVCLLTVLSVCLLSRCIALQVGLQNIHFYLFCFSIFSRDEFDGNPRQTTTIEYKIDTSPSIRKTIHRKSPGSSECRTIDCFDRHLRQLFAAWGRFVSQHPWPVLLIPIIITLGLSSGFLFMTMETNQEKIYTPINGQAKIDRKTVEDLFASVSSENETTPARLTELGRYVQIIFTKNDDESVLTSDLLDKVSDIHRMVLDHVIVSRTVSYGYHDLCITWKGSCLPNNVLTLYEDNRDYFIDNNITYPYSFLPDGNVGFLGAELGGVTLWAKDEFEPEFSPVESAQALRLLYYLKSDGEFDDISGKLEAYVVKQAHMISKDWIGVRLVAFASRTPDDEVKAATFDTLFLFPLAAGLLLIFTVCRELNNQSARVISLSLQHLGL